MPGQVVDFVTFADDKANLVKHWTFAVPPYKNFGSDGNRICQINYLDSNSKLILRWNIDLHKRYDFAFSADMWITLFRVISHWELSLRISKSCAGKRRSSHSCKGCKCIFI